VPNESLLPAGLLNGWRLAHCVRLPHCYEAPRQSVALGSGDLLRKRGPPEPIGSMPLLTCPDCTREVSAAAHACPHCGRPQNAGGFQASSNGPVEGAAHSQNAARRDHTRSDISAYSTAPRPWVRYFARILDIFAAVVLATIVIAIVNPLYLQEADAQYGITWLAFLLWIPIEAVCLASFSSTPGKALLRTRVLSADRTRLPFGKALSRAVRVWFFGTGTGFPLAGLFTMTYQHSRLKKDGIVSWDRKLATQVEHASLSAVRIAVAVAIITGMIALNFLPS
jgi:hypothetical protein